MATHPRNETTNGGGEAGVSTLNIFLKLLENEIESPTQLVPIVLSRSCDAGASSGAAVHLG